MSELEALIAELRDAHDGNPWHGPSRASVLADVALAEASRHPGGSTHGIWELVLHMRSWTREVTQRVRGRAPAVPDDGDWPALPSPTAAAWTSTLASLDDAHEQLIAVVRDLSPARLSQRIGATQDSPLGTGVTVAAILHGVAQHDAYHTGQIAMLKRLYREPHER